MMRKLGFHHIKFPNGSHEDMVVVEVDGEGKYLSHHSLQGEEAFVEWIGGTYEVMNDKEME